MNFNCVDIMKICKVCDHEKSLNEYNVWSSGGTKSYCKTCEQQKDRDYRAKNREALLEIDRIRNQRPDRKEYRREYFKTERGRKVHKQCYARSLVKHPDKIRARRDVSNALKKGLLIKKPCVECGEANSQAHHEDYSKPLEVVWFCFPCHTNHHNKERMREQGNHFGKIGKKSGKSSVEGREINSKLFGGHLKEVRREGNNILA